MQSVVDTFKRCWPALVLCGVAFMALAFVLLTPLVSLLFRGFLALSGRTVLADLDIVQFLLHPIGWVTLVVVGGASVGILALEQSALMAIWLSAAHERQLGVLASLRFVAWKTHGVFAIAGRIVARAALLTVPFLAVGGGIYLVLLTGHDINFYLTEKPPRFYVAAVLIGLVLAALVAVLVRVVVSWAVALPLYLFEDVAPSRCLAASRDRVAGHRKKVAGWVVLWIVVNTLVALVGTSFILAVGRLVVPAAASSLWKLVVTLGIVLVVWDAIHIATSLLAIVSFSVLLAHVYERFGRGPAFHLPEPDETALRWAPRLTAGRVAAGLVIATLAAALVGVTALHTVRLEDHVQITAHRGASSRAPENTLAAVRAAIEDQADWVEIDVQESKDGVVVVAHDRDLMKVSGIPAQIWQTTAEDLRAIDIGSRFAPEFKDERVPTLGEVLLACKGQVGVNIELKFYGHDEQLEQRVVDVVEAAGMADQVVIMSLKPEAVRKVKELRPEWTVGLLTAVAVGNLTRSEADFLAVSRKLATRRFIQSAHRRERDVLVWTLNDPIAMSTMISRGADNLITDYPDVARRVVEERAAMSPVERILIELAFAFGAKPVEAEQ